MDFNVFRHFHEIRLERNENFSGNNTNLAFCSGRKKTT